MSLVGSYAFYGKLLHDLFVTGQAKVEIVRAANVVIEEVVGTVTIKPAGGAVFQIEPTGTAVFTVKAEAGYFYVRTETGQRLDINIAHIEDGVVFNVAQSGDWTINARQTGEWNVYIQTKSDVEIRIAVVNATIALPIDIQATTIALAIDIQATTIALPVDIQAQTINLKIDIAAQSIDLIKIDIASASIGQLAIDIANVSYGTIDINIEAQNPELNITVLAPSGNAVSTQQIVSRNDYKSWEVSSGSSVTRTIATGKGRFKRLIGHIFTTDPSAYVDWRNIVIFIRADGEDKFSAGGLKICAIDEITGAVTIHSVEGKAAGETWPPYRPGRAFRVIYVKHADITDTYEPTSITVNTFSLPFRELSFEIEMDIEFENSLEIEVANGVGFSPTADIIMMGWVEWGEYL